MKKLILILTLLSTPAWAQLPPGWQPSLLNKEQTAAKRAEQVKEMEKRKILSEYMREQREKRERERDAALGITLDRNAIRAEQKKQFYK